MCQVVTRRGADPFEVNVRRSLETLTKYLPGWKLLDELLLDAEALSQLAAIVQLQEQWVRHQASSLYLDPLVTELKIRMASPQELAQAFIKSWHPIVWLDQISRSRLIDAVNYWNRLMPFDQRVKERFGEPIATGRLSVEDLVALEILSPEEFETRLQRLWRELLGKGRVDYWAFIYTEDFQESVLRAYLTSFLVTEGYAVLEAEPLEERLFLTALPERSLLSQERLPKSVPVAISFEDWRARRGR